MKKFETCESVVFEVDGQKIFAILHKPIAQKHPAPAVLMCHGLAGNKTGRFRLYVNLARELSKAGIASLRVDFRGCGDSEGEFNETSVHGFLKDALKSLHVLSTLKGIDPERIGIFGRSFGAAIAIITGAEYEKIKSIALWAPLFDTKQWQEKWNYCMSKNTPQYIRDQLLYIDGQQGSENFFQEFFAINLKPSLEILKNTPLFHIHGIKDDVIDIKQADFYEDIRSTSNAISKFIRLDEADHNFSRREDQLLAIYETVKWFKATL